MSDIKSIADLTADPANARKHTPRNIGMIERSLNEVGAGRSIVVDEDLVVLAGNGLIEAAAQAGIERVRVIEADGDEIIAVQRKGLTPEQKTKLALFDNRTNELSGWDASVLSEIEPVILEEMFFPEELSIILEQAGTDILESIGDSPPPATPEQARASLADRFGVPPFSVLDARQGYWQARKRAWIALGIQSELGRGDAEGNGRGMAMHDSANFATPVDRMKSYNAAPGGSLRPAASLGKDGKTVRGDGRGRGLAQTNGQDLMRGEGTNVLPGSRKAADQRSNLNGAPTQEEWAHGTGTENMASGTSIFDPVLCELAYRWFCPEGGAILDPFAGGSVRGVVASLLGRQYTGIDLRPEQIAANEEQARAITPDSPPRWIVGDSRDVGQLAPGEYDLIFSCPPYADLEVYSDDPRDLSTLGYREFIEAYRAIIISSVSLLKPDRFACFVVGDVRDKKGFYRNFVSATIEAFQEAGAILYNEAILVTAVGSLPIRIAKQFEGYRKLGKTHQNVLVFYKGDPKKIKDFGPVEMGEGDIAEQFGEVVD